MREFENEAENPTLLQYLELITLQTNADEIDGSEKLTLMTVHAAKGLEFPVVWVSGLEERLFPLSRDQLLSNADLEEERRLAYVAFTRAEQRLFLSYACARRLHGDMLLGIPSRFLDEIPSEHLEAVSRVDTRSSFQSYGGSYRGGYGDASPYRTAAQRATSESGSRYEYDEPAPRPAYARPQAASPTTRSGGGSRFPTGSEVSAGRRTTAAQGSLTGVRGGGSAEARRSSGESYVDRSDGDGAGELSIGMHVRHAKYGDGEVTGVEPGRPPRVTVRFAGWGVKQILASYLEPA
jgi:DNA helicase-2/ATP-dependent DNA helicase PcrA